MIITEKNYAKYCKRVTELQKDIRGIKDVFNSTSFAVKNKIVKFNEINNALKQFEKSQPMKSK